MSNRNPTFLLSAHIPLALSPPARPRCLYLAPSSRFYLSPSPPIIHGNPVTLYFVLFPPQPDSRDSHEYSSHDLLGRLEREESSLIYRPFSLLPLSFSLSLSLRFCLFFRLCLYLVDRIASRRSRFRSRWKMETSIKSRVAVATLMMIRLI